MFQSILYIIFHAISIVITETLKYNGNYSIILLLLLNYCKNIKIYWLSQFRL